MVCGGVRSTLRIGAVRLRRPYGLAMKLVSKTVVIFGE
jgi:hypothetical protein